MFEFISDLNIKVNLKLYFEEYLIWREDVFGSFLFNLEYWGLGFKIFIIGFKKKKGLLFVWFYVYGNLISIIDVCFFRMFLELNLIGFDYKYD